MLSLPLTACRRLCKKPGKSKHSRSVEDADKRGAGIRALGLLDLPVCSYIVVPSEHRAYVADLVTFLISQTTSMDAAVLPLRWIQDNTQHTWSTTWNGDFRTARTRPRQTSCTQPGRCTPCSRVFSIHVYP